MQEEYCTRINGMEKRINGDLEKLSEKIDKTEGLALKHNDLLDNHAS